jgi:hypothetical protein
MDRKQRAGSGPEHGASRLENATVANHEDDDALDPLRQLDRAEFDREYARTMEMAKALQSIFSKA